MDRPAGIACFIVSLAFGTAANAQGRAPIDSERPSFSGSPIALAPGLWQIEAGYEYQRERDGISVTVQTLPEFLLRYGLRDDFELQLGWDGYTRVEAGGSSTTGVTDASVGLKIQLTETQSSVPVAFFAGVSLPIGETGFTSDSFDPTIAAFWKARSSLDWFGTVALTLSDGDYALQNGVGVNFALGSGVSAFAEWELSIPERGSTTHELNIGAAWLQNNDLQLDVHGSVGLNSNAPDYGVGIGVAYRL